MSRKGSKFINIEAESDDEVDSSIVSEDFDNYSDNNTSDRAPVTRTKSQLELTRELEARYANFDNDYEEDDEEEEVVEMRPQASLLPTPRSPLLFLVRCLNGKEREICQRLGAKIGFDGVISVVHKEGLRGYFYVEAYRKQSIDDFLAGVRGVYRNRMSVVPLREMVEAVSQEKEFVISEYARVRNGKYAGDIVRVGQTHEHTVEIIALPRINGVRKKFDPREHRGAIVAKDGGFYFNRDFYCDGYLHKTVLKKSLDFDAEPAFADLRGLGVTRSFGADDTVAVARGELRSLIGRVLRVDGTTALIAADGTEYEVALKDLVKHYEVGQEVSYKDVNGVVVQCKDGQVVIAINEFTDEVHCSVWDLEPACLPKIIRNNNTRERNRGKFYKDNRGNRNNLENKNKGGYNSDIRNNSDNRNNKGYSADNRTTTGKVNITPSCTGTVTPGYNTPDVYGTHSS